MVYLKAQYCHQSYLIYIPSDLPPTNSRKFIYADDLAMAYQHQNFPNMNHLHVYLRSRGAGCSLLAPILPTCEKNFSSIF
jgi:hypothetical protein